MVSYINIKYKGNITNNSNMSEKANFHKDIRTQ